MYAKITEEEQKQIFKKHLHRLTSFSPYQIKQKIMYVLKKKQIF